jgi:hypothetical protein
MQEIESAKSLGNQIYLAAGDLDTVNTAERGTTSHGRRVVRRRVLRTSNGVVQRGLRRFGLWR